ncbi:MAG: hypothetical protein SPI77_06130 [Corynebacterium sp.]|nr:hypothetical protein [Corynebacterium sp.]
MPKNGVIPTNTYPCPTHLYTSDDVALARFTSLFHHTPGELSIAQIVGIVVGVLGAAAAGGWAASQAGLLPALG